MKRDNNFKVYLGLSTHQFERPSTLVRFEDPKLCPPNANTANLSPRIEDFAQ
jgi:hypothetical protein